MRRDRFCPEVTRKNGSGTAAPVFVWITRIGRFLSLDFYVPCARRIRMLSVQSSSVFLLFPVLSHGTNGCLHKNYQTDGCLWLGLDTTFTGEMLSPGRSSRAMTTKRWLLVAP